MISASNYLDRARKERETPSVLRLRALQIRSGRPDATIFVFEGVDDVGPYEVWLKALPERPNYEPLPGSGKAQVLAFAEQVIKSEGDWGALYFFVDHDFDGLRGVEPHERIFCTAAYSVENYLCNSEVLESILIDEFRLAGRHALIQSVKELFGQVARQYCCAMREANCRMYCGSAHSLRDGNIESRVKRYISVTHDSVQLNPAADLTGLVPLKREPTSEELLEAEAYFDGSDFLFVSRGKLTLGFFLAWLEELHLAFRNKSLLPQDRVAVQSQFRRNELNLRNLAARCSAPEELRCFLVRAFATD